ncbi:MAG: gamma-glutamyltransferase [Deltaproteobacteria bacterium]|nr:gamma-glutamyltransferase [Deltaproteobacteria bacterium]
MFAALDCAPRTPPEPRSNGVDVAHAGRAQRRPRTLPQGQPEPPRLALGVHGAVASQDRLATEIGLAVLRRGGNAVDAAIAVGFALAVTHPAAGNVGGGGFMVIRLADGTASALDFRETAPGAATRNMYLDAEGRPTRQSLDGPKAAAIPGTVAGFELAHRRFGSVAWRELVAPAVELARAGHVLDAFEAKNLISAREASRKAGFDASARYFEKPDGSAFSEGERWVQIELSETLATIAADPGAFYRGPLATRLVAGVRAAGGIWTEADLAGYRALEREPMRFPYRGHEFLTMPLPSSGGIVLRQILHGCEHLQVSRSPWRSPDEIHTYVEIARRAYADRNALLGDPDFGSPPVAELTRAGYIEARMADIDPAHATPSTAVRPGLAPPPESHDTTHFSVVDEAGNAVATTFTLNASFGSKFVVPGLGVLLNDEMDDFAVKPSFPNLFGLVQGEPNAIAPGKRMLSSMTPTVVVKDGELRAVLGSPGGPTITTTVVQLARALLDHGVPIDAAVAAPRVHHQWLPDTLVAEEANPPALLDALRERGHAVELRPRIGNANVIEVDPTTRGFRAVADVSRGGAAAAAY